MRSKKEEKKERDDAIFALWEKGVKPKEIAERLSVPSVETVYCVLRERRGRLNIAGLDEEEVRREYYEKKATVRELSKRYRRNPSVISYVLRAGTDARLNRSHRARIEDVVAMYGEQEASITQIAETLGVVTASVKRRLADAGLVMRPKQGRRQVNERVRNEIKELALGAKERAERFRQAHTFDAFCRDVLACLRQGGLAPVEGHAIGPFSAVISFPEQRLVIDLRRGSWRGVDWMSEFDTLRANGLARMGWRIFRVLPTYKLGAELVAEVRACIAAAGEPPA